MNYLEHNKIIQKIIHNREKYLHFHPEVEVLIFIHFYKKCIRLMHNGDIMSAYFSAETTHLIDYLTRTRSKEKSRAQCDCQQV